MTQLFSWTIRKSVFVCLLFAMAVSAMAAKISVATSTYGLGQTMNVINSTASVDGFDISETIIPTTSTLGGYIMDYQEPLSDSNNASLSGFYFTIPVTNLDTLFASTYGILGCDAINDPNVTNCVADPENNAVVQDMETYSPNPQLIGGGTAVQFFVPDNGQGLAFFVVEDFSAAPTSMQTPQITLASAGAPIVTGARRSCCGACVVPAFA